MKDENQASDLAISVIQEITRVLWSVASLLAPWLVPLAPAVFFGWVIYQTAIDAEMPTQAATWAAIAAAVGLETVNIAANHAMLKLSHDYKDHPGKFSLSILFIIVYVTIGVVAMMFLPDVSTGVRIIGVGMFLLAPVAIGAQALTMDLVRVRDEGRRREAVEADDRQWGREQKQRQQELDHERRLALAQMRWTHKTKVALSASDRQVTGSDMPPVRRWRDKSDFLADSDRPTDITAPELATVADISERTAYRWLDAAENGKESE